MSSDFDHVYDASNCSPRDIRFVTDTNARVVVREAAALHLRDVSERSAGQNRAGRRQRRQTGERRPLAD